MDPDPFSRRIVPPPPGTEPPVRWGATFAGKVMFVAGIGLLILVGWHLTDVIVLLFGAIIAATALSALAAPLQEQGLSRRASVAGATLAVFALLALALWLTGEPLAEQLRHLRERLPAAFDALSKWLDNSALGLSLVDVWNNLKAAGVPWTGVATAATLTITVLADAVLILAMGIYLAADPGLYRRGVVRLMPLHYRERVDEALLAAGEGLQRWLMGQAISMLFVGCATAFGLWLIGMPLALSLGVIAGLLDFVPFFGPIASGLLAVLLAFIEGPQMALYVAGVCILIQQIEGNVLLPFIQRWAVELAPVLALISVVVFGLLFGPMGAVFATPLMVVVTILVQRLYVEQALEPTPPILPP